MLSAAGCAAERPEPAREMVLRGTALALLQVDGDTSLQVAARWSTERADTAHPGVYIQLEDVTVSGSGEGAFDLQIVEPPPDAMGYEPDGDYYYTAADLVLLDDASLADGWVDAERLRESEVGRSHYIVYFVASDIPTSARGQFGIGSVIAGFHLLERTPDQVVSGDPEQASAGIALWEEVPLDTRVEIALGSDGDPTSPDS